MLDSCHAKGRFGPRPAPVRRLLLLCLLLPSGLFWPGAALAGAEGCGAIENRGQFPSQVSHCARCGSATLYFTPEGIVLVLPDRRQPIRIGFESPAGTLTPESCGKLDLHLNFFHGDDPARWRSDVPVYDRLAYRGLWGGSDLILRPVAEGLRYAISKTPALSRPESPFVVEGAERVTKNVDGTLAVEVAGALLTDRPVPAGATDGMERILSWAPADGAASHEAAENAGSATSAGSYDWGTFLGGGDQDRTHGVAVDSQQRPIVIGYTRSFNFPVGEDGWDPSHNGDYDVFILTLNPDGASVSCGTFLGGSGEDRPMDIKLDSTGNLLVGGTTTSANFPTTPGAWDRTGTGRDGFLAKFDPDGTQLLWGTYLGGTVTGSGEFVWNIEMGSGDEPVVCGRTDSNDFPVTPYAYRPDNGGSLDGFVTRLTAGGDALVWSTYIGGTMSDEVFDFVLDDQERPILAVMTSTPGMYTSPGAYDSTFAGARDFMITILSSDGRTADYSTYFGGPGDEGEARIARDAWGGLLLSGFTMSATGIAVGDVCDATHNGGWDAFVARFDAWGTSPPLWSTYLGGSGNDACEDVFFDDAGGVMFCGFAAAGFPVTQSAFQPVYGGGASDAFVAQLDPQGKTLLYSTYLGGSDLEELWDMAPDGSNHTYISGLTGSADFPTTVGAFDRTFNSPPGGRDAVLVCFSGLDIGAGPEPEARDARLNLRSRSVPNPASGSVWIRYDLAASERVVVEIFDASGALVRRLDQGRQPPGLHDAVWDGCDGGGAALPSGIYFVRVRAGGRSITGKIALAR